MLSYTGNIPPNSMIQNPDRVAANGIKGNKTGAFVAVVDIIDEQN